MIKKLDNGIWEITFGIPEEIVPSKYKAFEAISTSKMEEVSQIPVDIANIKIKSTKRGYQLLIPFKSNEQFYGLGLQLKSHNQRAKKKKIRVNSDPTTDLGDSHAPVPFIVSTAGYGILVDSARDIIFDVGSSKPKYDQNGLTHNTALHTNTDELYANRDQSSDGLLIIEVPSSEGVTLQIFGGPTILNAVQRYVLYSGGGAVPPRYGLGTWYRPKVDFNQQQVLDIAKSMRQDNMPIDIIGLEPGWLSTSYPCSYLWDNEKFPNPKAMINELSDLNYKVNNWIHAFIHRSNPLYDKMYDKSGDYFTFHGLTPDFLLSETRDMVSSFYDEEHVSLGVSGYKLDECDSSDYLYGHHWSFPECSEFPSGADGEQYHSLFGIQYQRAVFDVFKRRNQRTIGQARCSHSYAAPYPFFLYSDLYNHKDFVRGVVNCGFSGLLWSPEVRDAKDEEDLLRRVQAVVLSPHSLINAWYIAHCPWKQYDMDKNNSDEFLLNAEELTDKCRALFELRQSLIPYLYSAYYDYYLNGTPPFRALVMDYPDDDNCHDIDDEYMIGGSLLAAPVISGEKTREVYLPKGVWYNFFTGEKLEGNRKFTLKNITTDTVPLYIKAGTIMPLAEVTQSTEDPASFNIKLNIYGDGSIAAKLYEDDDATYNYKDGYYNTVTISYEKGNEDLKVERDCNAIGGEKTFKEYNVVGVKNID